MNRSQPNSPADVLALGFGAAAAMWTVGYICRLPVAMGLEVAAVPASLLFAVFILIGLAAGYLAGRWTPRGLRGGLAVGAVGGLVNLLILGSLLGRQDLVAVHWERLWWIPASVAAAMLVGAAGALLGVAVRGLRQRARDAVHAEPAEAELCWPARLIGVAAVTTLLLLAVGGAVTGANAGLAVVDWPNSFGYNMFLYPLARMTGGIYLEHAHRLFGSLVGLMVLVLAVYLQRYEPRGWMKLLGWLALALVITQGVLGGLRVTGRPTLSVSPEDTSPNLYLAVLHGVLGQAFFVLLVAMCVVSAAAWARGRRAYLRENEAGPDGPTGTDVALSTGLVAILLVQLVLGALVRHFSWSVHMHPSLSADTAVRLERLGQWALGLHIVVATLVALLALATGMRAWGLYERLRPLHRLGLLLMILVGVQLALGILAFVLTGDDSPQNPPRTLDIAVTTLHQSTGALLLATATATTLWTRRLATQGSAAPHAMRVPT